MINGLSDDVRFICNLVIIFFVFFLCFSLSLFFFIVRAAYPMNISDEKTCVILSGIVIRPSIIV